METPERLKKPDRLDAKFLQEVVTLGMIAYYDGNLTKAAKALGISFRAITQRRKRAGRTPTIRIEHNAGEITLRRRVEELEVYIRELKTRIKDLEAQVNGS